ncbi:phage NrS-1 polymerase family protein [Sphingomonas sp. RS2018]
MQFHRIPAPMQAYRQFVVWRYEQRDGSKPTKNLYSPNWGGQASVTDPTTWGSFDEAVAAHAAGGWEGIGFVFTNNDPFAGIDLDDASDDAEAYRRQMVIEEAFASYTELSPSGRGVHIIVEGAIPNGRRRAKVEVYSADRFFTMTGNVYRDAPIANRHDLLNTLWAEMGGAASAPGAASQYFRQAVESDEAVFERAAAASNGKKFMRLWNGDASAVDGSDRSGSAIDQALVNVLAFYTDDPDQIERLWLRSPQGQRAKTQQREDYRSATITRAFDRHVPQPDFAGVAAALKGVVDQAQTERREPLILLAPDDPFPIVNAAELAGKPVLPRSWHVAEMVPARTVTLLNGDGGTGKSLLALQLAYATAAGLGWVNTAVRSGDCLFVTAEDEIEEVHRRLADIVKAEGPALDRLPHRLAISPLAGRDAVLAVPDGRSGVIKPTAVYQALAGYVAAHRPALVVLDTLADMFGGEENNRAQARQFIGGLRGLALEMDTTVLLLAHPSLSGMSNGSGQSGSTAWNNSVRSRLYLKRDESNPHYRILETKKSNYGRTGGQIRLEWQSGVLVETSRTSNEPAHRVAAENAADELFMELLAEFAAQGRNVSQKPKSTNYAPKAFAGTVKGSEYKVAGFEAAMERLFAAGQIRIEQSEGAPSRRADIIVASGGSNTLQTYLQTPSIIPANTPTDTLQTPFEHVLQSSPIPPKG